MELPQPGWCTCVRIEASAKVLNDSGIPREGASRLAALARQLEEAHDIQRPLRRDCQRRSSENGVAQIRIIIAVVAGGRGNAPIFERIARRDGQDAPVFFRFISPRLVRGNTASAKIHFLRIEGLFHETALGTEQNKTWPRRRSADPEQKYL